MRLLLASALLLACVTSSLTAKLTVSERNVPAQPREGGAGHGHGGPPHGGGHGIHGGPQGPPHGGGPHSGPHGGGPIGGHHGSGSDVSIISLDDGGGDSYHDDGVKDSGGYYYYYYPVMQDGGGKKGIFSSGNKGFFAKMMETVMYPFMYPFMRIYDYFDGRALTARASDYLPMPLFQKVVAMVEEEIYKEECLSRMICQLGKSAEGYETFVHLSEFFVPMEYQAHLRTFKDSALKKSNCALKYKCTSLDPTLKV